MVSNVVGYREFNSKKGNKCRVLTLMSPYSDRDKEKGCIGNRVEDVFIPETCDLQITEASIGQIAVVEYSIFGGRAFVNNIILKKS